MNSLHHKLFFRYAALIFPLIAVFMIVLYIILGNTLRENASSELQADCDNISTLLGTELEKIDTLSQNVVSSSQVRSLFLEDLYSYNSDSYTNRHDFSSALFDIIKLSFSNLSLNIVDTDGRHVYVGSISSFQRRDSSEIYELPWFQDTLELYGKKVILPPRVPELNPQDGAVISLCRAFSPESTAKETAVLEMQVQYSYLTQKIEDAIHDQTGEKQVYIYNSDGERIYPYEITTSENLEDFMQNALSESGSSDYPRSYSPESGAPMLIAWQTSDSADWTIFVTASEKALFSSFYEYRSLLIMIAFIVLLLLLFITYQIASHIAAPLQKLEETARSITIDNLTDPLPEYKSGFKEMDSLFYSFEQMQTNLKNSLQENINAHAMANDAKMIALQSQMNPHFLYNTLASISILAEDGENEKVINTCTDLSSLLRYCSSNKSMTVDIRQEVDNLIAYIHLIKIKYEERIQFHIQIHDDLMSLQVPKLILQPLVENCVKYALTCDPPWIITIDGFLNSGKWTLRVRDNGAGFSHEYLSSFYEKIKKMNPENPLPDLSINGMGLLNLYIRLYLKYKTDLIFDLRNLDEGGAQVMIGGPLQEYEGENSNGHEKNPSTHR